MARAQRSVIRHFHQRPTTQTAKGRCVFFEGGHQKWRLWGGEQRRASRCEHTAAQRARSRPRTRVGEHDTGVCRAALVILDWPSSVRGWGKVPAEWPKWSYSPSVLEKKTPSDTCYRTHYFKMGGLSASVIWGTPRRRCRLLIFRE